jgi:hypothetical protein
MASPGERDGRAEELRGVMERLCAPDLTLAESVALRARLAELLGRPGEDAPATPAVPFQERAPGAMLRVAG